MTDTVETPISQRRKQILDELTESATPAPGLIAVSKRQPEARIVEALDAGQRVFGENQVQEAQRRWSERRRAFPDLQLHLVGALQSNKARDAAALFDVIHSVDRRKLVDALARVKRETGAQPKLLVQVNTGEEPQKSGIEPSGLGSLLEYAGDEGLVISGLMCIPPLEEPAAPHFALLAKLARAHGLEDVSMGMSGDYALAAQLGATLVRVGTAFFGPRPESGLT